MEPSAEVRLLNVRATAKYLSVSVRAVRRLRSEGEIDFIRLSNKHLFDRRMLDKWIEQNRERAV